MKKKVLPLMLVLVMVMALTVPALAADSDFVIENGVLTKYKGPGGSVVIPSGVTSIGQEAFAYNAYVTDVTIPDGVTDIGIVAFSECYSLTSVTIPNSVTSISEGAFNNCFSLTSITIPNSVTTIGRAAFQSCSSLTSVTIPDSVTSIIENPFMGCNSLTDISVGSGNQTYTAVDGVLFSKDMTALICYPKGRQGPYVIPDSVTTIGDYAFESCEGLTNVTIPNSVTTIGGSAFRSCEGLTDVTIPNSVTTIGSSAFQSCEFTSITIPNSVTSMSSAFTACSYLTSVTIPANITNMDYAFIRCSDLTSVTIMDGVTNIGRAAFSQCESLTSVTIPASVTSIGQSAFSECDRLFDVYYSGSESQWKQINIDRDNEALFKSTATIHCNSTGPDKSAVPSTSTTGAVLSPQKLTVDGKDVECEKYNIGGSNYFKLRDLAQVLSGTGSQFDVRYDEATATVRITTGKMYIPNGTELLVGVDNSASAQPSSQAIRINGANNKKLTVYNIGGSNFFQLRELANLLNFEVGYDIDTNTATVTPQAPTQQTSTQQTGTGTKTATSLGSIISGDYQLITRHDVDDMAAVENNIRYMLKYGVPEITLETKGLVVPLDFEPMDEYNIEYGMFDNTASTALMDRYGYMLDQYFEFGYNSIYVNDHTRAGENVKDGISLTIHNLSYGAPENLVKYQDAAFSAAKKVHDDMWASGKITSSMTQKEKARVYYDWIAKNVAPDTVSANNALQLNYNDTNPESWMAYGAFVNGQAVCEGYTAAYNLLLRMEGISCGLVSSLRDRHGWSAATLDGVLYHIDATWGDQGSYADSKYFCMTEDAAWARFGGKPQIGWWIN